VTRSPSAVRQVRYRTIGSRTTLTDEMAVPAPLYHGGRGVRWLWRHKLFTGSVAAVWYLWLRLGSLAEALVLFGVLAAGGLTVWVLLSRRRAEGASGEFSMREAIAVKRQKATLEKQWGLACKTAGLLGPDSGSAPALRQVKATGGGTLTASVSSGQIGVPVPSIQKRTVELAEVIGCREVVVTQTGPGVATLTFHWRDALGRVLPLRDLPIAPKGQIAYGIRQDGGPATLKMNLSVLIGGLTEFGKSNTIHALIADLIRQGIPTRLYISDPKGGMELREYGLHLGERNGCLEVRRYEKTAAGSEQMIADAAKAMAARTSQFEAEGRRSWEPTERDPLVVVVCDELLELDKTMKAGAGSDLAQIVRLGRAVGYTAWICSQVGQMDAVGRLRNFIPQRFSVATRDRATTDTFLGDGASSAGALCHELRDKGVGYALNNSDRTPMKVRVAFVPDADLKAIAAGLVPQGMAEGAEDMTAADRGETALYRWYSVPDPDLYAGAEAEPQLLYVGISYDVLARESQHNAGLREFMRGDVRREVDYYPTRKAAAAAEKLAIETERPLYNKQHNQRNPRRLVDKRRKSSDEDTRVEVAA
jgi:predicted GIY-YIG superfamily endonuclease